MRFPEDTKVSVLFKGNLMGYYLNGIFYGEHGFRAGHLVNDQHITEVDNGHKGEVYGHIVGNKLILTDGKELELKIDE